MQQKRIITSCKDCCFAVYEGITQTGCDANRLEIFKNHNIKIVEAYDEEKQFYIIPNRQCMFKRSQEWYNKKGSNESAIKVARDEIKFQYHAIVVCNDNLDNTIQTVESLKTQTIKPELLTIAIKSPINSRPNMEKMRNYLKSIDMRWHLENIINPEISDIDDIYSLIVVSNKLPFLVFIKSGHILSTDFFDNIRSRIIDELLQFTIITNPNIDIVPSYICEYYKYTGDPTISILENIRRTNNES